MFVPSQAGKHPLNEGKQHILYVLDNSRVCDASRSSADSSAWNARDEFEAEAIRANHERKRGAREQQGKDDQRQADTEDDNRVVMLSLFRTGPSFVPLLLAPIPWLRWREDSRSWIRPLATATAAPASSVFCISGGVFFFRNRSSWTSRVTQHGA